MPPKITIQPVVNRGNKASTPSGALLVQMRTLYNQIVHLRALQATRGTLDHLLCNRLHDRALAAAATADEARKTEGLPEHLLDKIAESIGTAKRCARAMRLQVQAIGWCHICIKLRSKNQIALRHTAWRCQTGTTAILVNKTAPQKATELSQCLLQLRRANQRENTTFTWYVTICGSIKCEASANAGEHSNL